jgi:hypothetical protein
MNFYKALKKMRKDTVIYNKENGNCLSMVDGVLKIEMTSGIWCDYIICKSDMDSQDWAIKYSNGVSFLDVVRHVENGGKSAKRIGWDDKKLISNLEHIVFDSHNGGGFGAVSKKDDLLANDWILL